MPYVHPYPLSMLLVLILGNSMIFLLHKKIVSYRTARWSSVGAIILTVIPASLYVIWPFAVGVTLVTSTSLYWVFRDYEKTEKNK